jgi:hypothetical protein
MASARRVLICADLQSFAVICTALHENREKYLLKARKVLDGARHVSWRDHERPELINFSSPRPAARSAVLRGRSGILIRRGSPSAIDRNFRRQPLRQLPMSWLDVGRFAAALRRALKA